MPDLARGWRPRPRRTAVVVALGVVLALAAPPLASPAAAGKRPPPVP